MKLILECVLGEEDIVLRFSRSDRQLQEALWRSTRSIKMKAASAKSRKSSYISIEAYSLWMLVVVSPRSSEDQEHVPATRSPIVDNILIIKKVYSATQVPVHCPHSCSSSPY